MKKCISVLILLAIAAGGAFALDLSAGGGLLFGLAARNGIKAEGTTVDFEGYIGARNLDIGGVLFFDATYAEFDFYFAYGKCFGVFEKDFDTDSYKGTPFGKMMKGSMMQLGFSLVGKYPFDLGKLTVFPLAGISYNLVLSYKNEDGVSSSDTYKEAPEPISFSQFGFLAGAGLDLSLTSALFLRTELALQIRLPSKGMKDLADLVEDEIPGVKADATVGLGPRFKLCLGYKF